MKLEELAATLAEDENTAKTVASDLSQARAKRQQSAVDVIKHLHHDWPEDSVTGARHTTYTVRAVMLQSGVAKGTVSKIMTVVQVLAEGKINIGDVKSLNGAYTAAKLILATPAPAPVSETSDPASDQEQEQALIPPPTPDEALEIILDSIKTAGGGNIDAVFESAGAWISKITEAISDITRNAEDSGE